MRFEKVCKIAQDIDIFAAFFAASIHDFEHPGTNNAFHINTQSPIAYIYNDRHVLENHHIAASFKVTQERGGGCNIFKNLSKDVFKEVRETVIQIVLATDMSEHFEDLSRFKARAVQGGGLSKEGELEDRRILLKMLVHCADISNPAKHLQVCRKWAEIVTEEFFMQGDMEKKLNMPVSTFYDRDKPTVAKCQVGFITFIVCPLFSAWSEFCNNKKCDAIFTTLMDNKAYWEKKQKEEEQVPPPPPSPPPSDMTFSSDELLPPMAPAVDGAAMPGGGTIPPPPPRTLTPAMNAAHTPSALSASIDEGEDENDD
jgi:hypothetical protein